MVRFLMQQSTFIQEQRLDKAVDEAINFIRSNYTKEKVMCCFSGGKDSIVTEHLLKLSGIEYSLNSSLTGIDPPQVIKFIRKQYPYCSFVRPRYSFWHLLTVANPPGGTGRGIKWCCTQIKEKPSESIPLKNRFLGIRAEESPNRAKYERINNVKDQRHFYPIFHWKEWQIWEFIEYYNLPYPKLYDEGVDRIGCVICPNHYGRHDFYRKRWPKHFKCFEKYVNIWWNKRVEQGKDMWHQSVEDFLSDWYDGKFYYYKPNPTLNVMPETSRQIGLFDGGTR